MVKEANSMNIFRKVEVCGLFSRPEFYPMRWRPEAKGLKIRHLNIGQPDIEYAGCVL
jgi:hypothetical protein